MEEREFKDWLGKQTQETCVAIATRAALRVFPFVTHVDDKLVSNKGNLALVTARDILSAGVAAKMPTPEVMSAAAVTRAAISASEAFISDAATFSSEVTFVAVAFAISTSETTTFDAAAFARAFASNVATFDLVADTAIRAAIYLDTEIDPETLFDHSLWSEPREPDWLVSALIPHDNILESAPEWSFWREWYRGFLIGEPLDWALQQRIALIDEAIWDAGPEAVAEECPSSYKVGHQSGLSIGGSGSFV